MRYIVGLLIAIGLVFIFIIILVKVIFGGGGGQSEEAKKATLTEYEKTTTTMRLIIEGPIVSDEDFRQVQINVGRDANTAFVIHGYRGDVAKQETVSSNAIAYGNFLRAIELNGFGSGDGKKNEDYRGFCPTGSRYIYQIVKDNKVDKQYWATSCGDAGTFQGQSDMVNQLFQEQIPNYFELTGDLSL